MHATNGEETQKCRCPTVLLQFLQQKVSKILKNAVQCVTLHSMHRNGI